MEEGAAYPGLRASQGRGFTPGLRITCLSGSSEPRAPRREEAGRIAAKNAKGPVPLIRNSGCLCGGFCAAEAGAPDDEEGS
jgi:hypothetical protein